MIEVPYWWDQKIESLAATIQKYRPDIKLPVPIAGASPIPAVRPALAKMLELADRDPAAVYLQVREFHEMMYSTQKLYVKCVGVWVGVSCLLISCVLSGC